jgi:hypothetical protein
MTPHANILCSRQERRPYVYLELRGVSAQTPWILSLMRDRKTSGGEIE